MQEGSLEADINGLNSVISMTHTLYRIAVGGAIAAGIAASFAIVLI